MKRKLMTGLTTAAIVFSATTPAFADRYDRGHGHHGRRHHRDRIDGGDVVAGVALIAILAAVLSTSKKRRGDAERPGDAIRTEDAAVDACAKAAEAVAGDKASVRDIIQVDPIRDGWTVEGSISHATKWDGEDRRFTCTVRNGGVQGVTFENGAFALQ